MRACVCAGVKWVFSCSWARVQVFKSSVGDSKFETDYPQRDWWGLCEWWGFLRIRSSWSLSSCLSRPSSWCANKSLLANSLFSPCISPLNIRCSYSICCRSWLRESIVAVRSAKIVAAASFSIFALICFIFHCQTQRRWIKDRGMEGNGLFRTNLRILDQSFHYPSLIKGYKKFGVSGLSFSIILRRLAKAFVRNCERLRVMLIWCIIRISLLLFC